jgi:hypothetical protein
VLLLLLGCDTLTATWIDQRPACAAEPYAWTDDLESWVAAGEGDGSFNLDPADDPRIGLNGTYDPATGQFGWTTTYDEKYWMTVAKVEDGKGTAWHNGDLDVQYTVQYGDTLGTEWSAGVRTVREGCSETTWAWDPSADDPTYVEQKGTWSADSFDWTIAADGVDTWEGSLASDLTRTTVYTNDTVDQHSVVHPDGTGDADFTNVSGDYTFEGSQHTEFTGAYTATYDIVQDGETVCSVEEDRTYSGAGTAHYDCGKTEFDCDYSVSKKGACTYECTDGESGDC